MNVNEETLRFYREQYGFDSWSKDRGVNANLFIWHFYLAGGEFARWEPVSIRRVELPRMAPLVTSTWLYQKNKKSRVSTLSVDIVECERRADAHAELLQMLRQFQAGDPELYEYEEIGDVAFATPRRTSLLFTRANLAVKIGNGSEDAVEVDEWALHFDKYLIKRPAKTSPLLDPQVEAASAPFALLENDPLIPLEVGQTQWQERNVWYKFFSRTGRVRRYRGRVCYRAAPESAQHNVTIYAVNPADGAGKQAIQVAVPEPA